MKTCPQCGKPMRIARSPSRTHQRHWLCTDYRCGEIVLFADGERLSIAEITDSMAREALSSSDDQRKKQVAYRRTAGALSKIRNDCPFLSPEEDDALRAAAAVLARLGDAAEKAKKVKKQIEEADRKRRAERRAVAMEALQILLDGDDAMTLVRRALTLAHVVNSPSSYYLESGDRLSRGRKAGQSFSDALVRAAQAALNEHSGEAADSIARSEQPVDTLVATLLQRIEHDQAKITGDNCLLLDGYAEQLRIDAATNVVTLPKKDRH